jgi:RimJ/RimL family protein N-acetyltransferase
MKDNAVNSKLTGNYVSLRPMTIDDANQTLSWRNSSRAHFLNRGATILEEQQKWILNRPSNEYNFIIETLECREIGTVALTNIDIVNSRAEPGRFLIGDEKAARGIPAAAEAMLLIYRFAFDQLKLHRVYGFVAAENGRMVKWQKYLGMTHEGTLKDHYLMDGHFQDAILFGMLEDEYRNVCSPRLESLVAMARNL